MIELIKEKLGFHGYFFLYFVIERTTNGVTSKRSYVSYIHMNFYVFDMDAVMAALKKNSPDPENITGIFITYYKRVSKAEYEINLN